MKLEGNANFLGVEMHGMIEYDSPNFFMTVDVKASFGGVFNLDAVFKYVLNMLKG